ncbi:AMP binding enzyme [Ceratobasidium sp. AG-Ba]|nr:AMP binding enzyme [Ceratobasidium sp. AG-Ba]
MLIWLFHTVQVAPPPAPVHTEYPVALAFLPMYHTMGLHIYIFRHFFGPSTQVVLPSWNVENVLMHIKIPSSAMALVPSLVFQLLAHPKFKSKEADFSSLQGLGTGAYLPPAITSELNEGAGYQQTEKEFLGVLEGKGSKGAKIAKISSGYGLSESTIAVISAGVLLPGCEARLCHEAPSGTPVDDLVDVAPGEPGELYVRSELNALGYWTTKQPPKRRFYRELDEDGRSFVFKDDHFWFQDRSKDTLKVSGVQVSPTEIEAVLKASQMRTFRTFV